MRKLFPLLILLIIAAVGVAVFLVLSDGSGPGNGSGPDVVGPTDPNAADAETDDRAKKPDEPSRRWVPRGPGRVTGVVREYGTDRPLSAVTVTLEAGLPGPNEVLSTVTGDDGSFQIADAINFDQWMLRVAATPPLGELIMGGVEVIEQQETNVGTLYVTASFEVPGIVVDEVGDPIAGATVRALRPRADGSSNDFLRLIRELPQRPPSVDAATTDAEGRFALTKVPAGRFDFELSAPEHSLRIERGIVVLPDTASRPLRFVLNRGYEIEGRVVRPTGGSVEGIQIVAFEQPSGQDGLFKIDKRFATTDASGEFVVRNLAAGDFVLAAVPEGRPFTVNDDVTVPGAGYVEIVLEGDAWVEGLVSNEDGEPIPDAEVFLVTQDRGNPSVGNAVSGADGRYRIDGLRSGPTQFFIVQATGYASYPDDLMSVFRGRGRAGLTLVSGENTQDVTLKKGATLSGIVIDQADDSPVAGARIALVSPQSLFGGSRTATSGADGKFVVSSVPMGPAVVTVEKEGYYQPGVNQQSIGMVIMGAMQRGSTPKKDTGRGFSISVTEPGETLERELKLAKGSTIRGIVIDPAGEPVVGAEVSLRAGETGGMFGGLLQMMGSAEPRLTSADGTFELPGPSPGTKARVVAVTRGWLEGTSDEVSPAPGESLEGLTVQLRRGATLEGTVKDAQGKGVSGALVRWLATGEDTNEWSLRWQIGRATPTVTADDGSFRIEQVEPGPVLVQVTHTDHPSVSRPGVQAEDGKAAKLEFALEAGGTLSGTALRPDGSPASGAQIDIEREGGWKTPGDTYARGPSDPTVGPDGSFEARGLPPGAYTLQARLDGLAPSAQLAWRPGDAAPTLRLEPAFRITGTVRFKDGRPAEGVSIQAVRKLEEGRADTVRSERTGADGAFELPDLPAGEYDVQVGQGWWGNDEDPVVPRTLEAVAAGTEGLLIEVTGGAAIAGTVTLPDGALAAEGWVSVARIVKPDDPDQEHLQRGAVIQGGAFHVTGLKPGQYQVTVNVPGAAARKLVAESGTEDLAVRLSAGGSIEGVVTGPTGTAAAGVNVWANSTDGQGNATTDENGRFTIKDLAPGTYAVQAWMQVDGGAQSGRSEGIEVTDGGSANGVQITLSSQ